MVKREDTLLKEYAKSVNDALVNSPFHEINAVVDVVFDAMLASQQVFVFGNGGSAATASHFAGDVGKTTALDFGQGVDHRTGFRLRIRSLTDNVTWLTAVSNDLSYRDVFLEQLKNFLNPGDVAIGISGSGSSPNVVRALEYAKLQGSKTVCLTSERRSAKSICAFSDIQLRAPVSVMEQIEDMHSIYCHMIVSALHYRVSRYSNQKTRIQSNQNGETYGYV